MSIGDDLKTVLSEVGNSFTIIRDAGNVSGEYLDYEVNRQVTKPFIREFFIEATLAYDTDAIAGDIIEIDTLSRQYLIMNKTPEMFENAINTQECVLYKCNVSGELLRFSGEGWRTDTTYEHYQQWDTQRSTAYGLLTENLFGTSLAQDEELGQIGLEAQALYVPTLYGAKALDRYEYVSGEFLKIEAVEHRKFDNIDVCHLAEDTR